MLHPPFTLIRRLPHASCPGRSRPPDRPNRRLGTAARHGDRAPLRPEVSAAQVAVFTYAILSRLAYVLFVGGVLRREDRDGIYTRRFGRAQAFRRFRRRAAVVMNHD